MHYAPHVVLWATRRYLEYFEEDTAADRCFFIVQQEARGRSLADMLQGGMRADEKEVCWRADSMGAQVCSRACRCPRV